MSEYQGEDLFNRMNRASEECLARITPIFSTIAKKNGVVEGYPMKECLEILGWIVDNLNLELPNEDWDNDLKYGTHTFYEGPVSEEEGQKHVKRQFLQILKRTQESAFYDCDKAFGFEEPPAKPRTEAEKIGELLLEPFTLERKQFFQSIPEEERNIQRNACKKAVLTLMADYDICIRSRISELR